MISYEPLWDTMKKKNVTTYTLRNKYGINAKTVYRLKHGMPITTVTLNDFCAILDCEVDEVIKYIKDTKET